jgi:hypothetical protein
MLRMTMKATAAPSPRTTSPAISAPHHAIHDRGVQIVQICTGPDRDPPWLEAQRISSLHEELVFRLAWLRPQIFRPAAAGASLVHDVHQELVPGLVGEVGETLTNPFLVRVDDPNTGIVVAEIVAVWDKAHVVDHIIGAGLGFLAGDLSLGFERVEALQHGEGSFGLRPQHLVAFMVDCVGRRLDLEEGRYAEGGHQTADQHHQLDGDFQVLHVVSRQGRPGSSRRSGRR